MKMNGWVASSQRMYRWLLRLYPQGYRTIYETEMFQLFTDQCREASKGGGRLGIVSLWVRTLSDVVVTVIHEHLSAPHVRVGLLEAAPNKPLPWKGVLLVLIPGLIFFISQVEQVISSNDWFFLAFYRAGYFLILPVLLVWLLTRRFPVWGLMPLGLLYGTLASYNPDYLVYRLCCYPEGPLLLEEWNITNDLIAQGYLIAIAMGLVLLGGIIAYLARQQRISRNAWKWLGFYGLLVVLGIAGELYRFLSLWGMEEMEQIIFQTPLWRLYQSLPLLILVFIGLFFARKHSGLAFLILLGYLLPRVIFGRYDPAQDMVPFYMVSLAVLVYRFIVALVAPVWLVRAASIPGRQRAAAIPVGMAIGCYIALNLAVSLALNNYYGFSTSLLDIALNVWDKLIIAAGLGLAVALYLPREAEPTIATALVATPE